MRIYEIVTEYKRGKDRFTTLRQVSNRLRYIYGGSPSG